MWQPCRRLQPLAKRRNGNLRADVRLHSASLGSGVETRHAVSQSLPIAGRSAEPLDQHNLGQSGEFAQCANAPQRKGLLVLFRQGKRSNRELLQCA